MITLSQQMVYLAGPMRGYPRWNFDNFDHASRWLRSHHGCHVISPAEIDRDLGFDPDGPEDQITPKFLREALRRDMEALSMCDAVILLPGWPKSKGAIAEASAAYMIDMPVYEITQVGTGLRELFRDDMIARANMRSADGDSVLMMAMSGERGEDQKLIASVGLGIVETLLRKNRDYGGSVFLPPVSDVSPGLGIVVRLSDKWNRIQSLYNGVAEVADESLIDTFRDLAGYAILWVVSRYRSTAPTPQTSREELVVVREPSSESRCPSSCSDD